jgi:glucokinase
MRILVGDIGGTNARLALFENDVLVTQQIVSSATASSLTTLVDDFIKTHGQPDACCAGIAGPVLSGQVLMTNLGWTESEEVLTRVAGAPFRLINDFHAQALAMPHLEPGDYVPLDDLPFDDRRHMAVLGSGTGLGEGILARHGSDWVAVAGEGSHGRFGPQNDEQVGLLRHLMNQYPDHVSVERVASGPGLLAVYDYLRDQAPRHSAMVDDDPAAVIVREALNGHCAICVHTVEIFVDVLADEAASLALKCNAGLIYVSGGIPPRIMPFMTDRFRAAFENKGRYRYLLEATPVRVVTHPDPGLMGAKIMAEQMLRSSG